ncbi:MAG: DUF1559 domain-containing protein, partial [Planctomycetales bacterium]|nr:DUF1559 domain-containing protein [Planctomycetales bacterium]
MSPARLRPAFTLVELLVVIAIIGVLVGLLLPAVQAAREAARRLQCQNNVRQIGLACHNYHATIQKFPPGRLVYAGRSSGGNPTNVVTGFLAMVLPYLEGSNLYNTYDQRFGFDDVANQTAVNTKVSTFLCPSAPGERTTPVYCGWNVGWTRNMASIPDLSGMATDYQGVRGIHHLLPTAGGGTVHNWDSGCGILNEEGVAIGHITDGTSNTILLFEMAGKPQHWRTGSQQPTSTDAQFYAHGPWAGNNGIGIYNWSADGLSKGCDTCQSFINIDNTSAPYSFHPGGISVVLADGS